MELTKEAKHYLEYLNKHIECVQKAYDKLKIIIPDLFLGYDDEMILKTERHIKEHDSIKFSPQRLKIYGEHFMKKDDPDEYNNVILEHIRCCPHHFQHWLVFYSIDKIEAVEMTYDYIIEMICDWYSFSFFKNDDFELIKWYEFARDKMIFAPKTQKIVDDIILKIKEYLLKKGENL